MNVSRCQHIVISLSAAGLLAAGLLLLLGTAQAESAGPQTLFVSTGGVDTGGCTNSDTPCRTVQYAVDQAADGGEILVATGTYTDMHVRPRSDIGAAGIVTQVVYVSKTVTVRGGYSPGNWTTPDPAANPTTLDAGGKGRVIYITGDISPTVEGLRITGGNAAGLGGSPSRDCGGGMYVITASLTMRDSRVFGNAAMDGGGLYFYHSADTTLVSNTMEGNEAGPLMGGGGTGGGLVFDNSPGAKLSDNVIDANRATHAGGLYFRYSPAASLVGNRISGNAANHIGGGMKHYGGGRFYYSDNATLIGNTISGNRAADLCGGMCFDASDNALLIGNKVISNSAGSPGFGGNAAGGGLYFGSSNGASLISNTVTSNGTYGKGGGMYVRLSDITLTNNVIADNQIISSVSFTGSGSGLYIAGSSAWLLHPTIARNSGGDGSGVYVTGTAGTTSTVAMTNTILVNHTVGITVATGNTARLNATLWYANIDGNWDGGGSVDHVNDHYGDPAFVAPGAGDYHIRLSSAAIDVGVNAGVSDDVDGDGRPLGSGYDIGADEFRPGFSDPYEPDNTCAQASALSINGTAQHHTFHDYADEDWASFIVTSGKTYVVQAASSSAGADLELELYDDCGQPPLPPDDEDTFGNDARLIFTAPSGGSYYIKVLNHDPAVYGWSVTYELSARPRSSAPIVAIVAGRNEADQLEDNITFMGDQAYRTFRSAGVPRENIRYLSAGGNRDADQDGDLDVNGEPTGDNVRYAVQDWPRERGLQPGKPFYLYMADHGGTDYFCASGCGDGMRVSAAELDGWLDDLENRTGADEVNVIVEACYSGSFIDVTTAATATVSSEGRVVIASTGSRARAFPSEHGGYFSDAFFTALGDNADLWTAYVAGRTAARAAWQEQTPWLDDNGDQVADGSDGEVARRRGLVALGGGSIPVVDWLQVGDVSESGTATITASVRDDVAVMTVTVEIYPPGFGPPDTGEGETPVLQIDRVVLTDTDGDGVYEVEYASFTDEGIYRLVAYAWDIDGNLSLPRQATVGEQRVYLPVVVRKANRQ